KRASKQPRIKRRTYQDGEWVKPARAGYSAGRGGAWGTQTPQTETAPRGDPYWKQVSVFIPACDLGHSNPQTSRAECWHVLCCEGAAMNVHIEIQKLEPSSAPAKPGLFRRILAFLGRVLSSPKGDQGGWEGGARGL